jgi:hypothetical protein
MNQEMPSRSPEDEATIAAFMQQLATVISGKSDLCIHCQQPFTSLEKTGRSVYAYPCGCRQFQGSVPARWQPSAKIHPYLQEQSDRERGDA